MYTRVVKNITFSADEAVIEEAREKARKQHTTLNVVFREWLAEYSGRQDRTKQFRELMKTWVDRPINAYGNGCDVIVLDTEMRNDEFAVDAFWCDFGQCRDDVLVGKPMKPIPPNVFSSEGAG